MTIYGIAPFLDLVIAARTEGRGAAIATVITDRSSHRLAVGSRIFVPEEGDVVGRIDESLDPVLIQDGRKCLLEKRSRFLSYRFTTEGAVRIGTQGGEVDVFFEVLGRPPRLVVVGAGHIAVPLVRTAKLLDFEVIVVDDRIQYANVDRFPEADQILVGSYPDSLATVGIDSDTHIVLVTRGHVHDQACLQKVLGSDAAYIGMIGSKKRVRTVMERLKQQGHDPADLQRVRAPIGLDIGAQTAAEIAVSIMGQIISLRRGGKAASLAMGERLRV